VSVIEAIVEARSKLLWYCSCGLVLGWPAPRTRVGSLRAVRAVRAVRGLEGPTHDADAGNAGLLGSSALALTAGPL
jgi:hypothetical protein